MAQGATDYATREAVDTERHMLGIEREGRGTLTPLYGRIRAKSVVEAAKLRSAERGHIFTKGQKDATQALLTSANRITGLQGAAGTAKTSTVISTFAEAARAHGLTIRAMAPTSAAGELLGRAVDAEHMTVKRMLLADPAQAEQGREVWIVDEASILAACDADQLVTRARDADARLVLVGDVKQLASVGAGRAFAQLQERGMETVVLDQIVRQTNDHTREAVEAMLAGEAARAFDAIDKGGGASSSTPRTIFGARSSPATSPHCPAKNAPGRSCSTRPARAARGSPMPSASHCSRMARSARMPWSRRCWSHAD